MRSVLMAVMMTALTAGAAVSDDFGTYREIQRDILALRVDAETVREAVDLFPKEQAFLDALETARAYNDKNTSNYLAAANYHLQAQFLFTALPSQEGVLYDFIMDQDRMLASAAGSSNLPSLLSWGWAYLAQGAVYGYQATHDQKFSDYVVQTVRAALTKTDKARGILDGFGRNDLIGWSLTQEGKSWREITTPARILSPILQLSVSDLSGLSPARKAEILDLASTAASILKPYLDEQVIEGDRRYFRFKLTGENDAVNHMAAFAEAAGFAYKLTGDVAFRDFVVGFRNYFMSISKVDEKGAFAWPYQVLAKGQYGEPFWKGAVTVSAWVNLQRAGIDLTDAARSGLVRSFSDYVIRDHYSINAYMQPDRDFPLTGYNSYSLKAPNGAGFTMFSTLEQWTPSIRQILTTAVASHADLFPMGMLISPGDAMGYGFMLRTDAERERSAH